MIDATRPRSLDDYRAFLEVKAERLAALRLDEPDRFRSTFIYALIDPRTDEVRYIGKSDRPTTRLAAHLRDRSNCHRVHWLQELAALNLVPALRILDEVPRWGWQDVEIFWIAYGHDQGWPLTNGTEGGDGVSGLSAESRERITAAWVGRKHSPETISKLREAGRRRRATPETRARMSRAHRGRVFSAEHQDKIVKALRKLTDEQVRAIRAALAGGESQYAIAERFGVHQGTVSNIKRGLSYGDVE